MSPSEANEPTKDPYNDPAAWWAVRGVDMVGSQGPKSPDHIRQEHNLVVVLSQLTSATWPSSVFEAGCGAGRMADFFQKLYPGSSYTAIDVGDAQLAETARVRPDAILLKGDITKLDAVVKLRRGAPASAAAADGYDLVITNEVLMHVRPGKDLQRAIRNLLALVAPRRGRLVIVEWVPLPGELESNPTAYWNFPHNYRAALIATGEDSLRVESETRTDRQMIFVVKP